MLHSRTITVADVQLSPDTSQAVEFLQSWPGYPVLSASHTELATGKKGLFETRSFPPPTDWNAVAKWVDDRQGKANLYFSVNPPLHAIDKKAERTDIARIVALQVDSDVRPGEDQVAGTARIIKMLEAYKVPPSLIISSGGGAQAFWLLEEPLDISGDFPPGFILRSAAHRGVSLCSKASLNFYLLCSVHSKLTPFSDARPVPVSPTDDVPFSALKNATSELVGL